MQHNNLPRIDIADLKVGDKVQLAYTAMVGWRRFRYPTFKEYTVERITPKKTKVYLNNGVAITEAMTSKTDFYQDCPELQACNRIAHCAQECNNLIFKIDSRKDTLHKLSDDEFLEIHGYLASALEILQKASSQ